MGECGDCRFWFEVPGAQVKFGLCRRRAPVPIMVAQIAPKLAGQPPQPVIQGYFPQTVAHAGCGDFEQAVGRVAVPQVDLGALDLSALEAEGEA
jgi:hypothetical protein